eukprot:GHUV01008728.1.p1 GENE.GHUV01008728.1~~GHUV01008728.1.p1  ORF type:complete len:259 (+),score=57.19 GHUV01008728.1:293-1069(+)
MLCSLLAGRQAHLLVGALQPAARLLSFHTSSTVGELSTVVTQSELGELPEATTNGDRLLDSTQLESLAIFRRYNITQPNLKGQVILAKVIRCRPDRLLVDPGYYGFNWVSKQELDSAVSYNADGQPIDKKGSLQIRPGEYVKVRVSHLNTPYGDMQLDPVGIPAEVRLTLVWNELTHQMKKGRPVKGRILNPTIKGYAVGVAGYVALLQYTHARPEMAQQIGTLQDFYIHKMDPQTRRIVLSPIKGSDEFHNNLRESM